MTFFQGTYRVWSLCTEVFRHRKQVLQEVAQYSDFTSEKFREIQGKIENSLETIKPSDEYNDFTEKHK